MSFKHLLFSAVVAFGLFSLASSQPFNHRQSASSSSISGNKNWAVYLGGNSRTHYSTLDQINKRNVSRLKVAWTYDTGERGEWEDNPLEVDGVVYIATHTRKVVALNAATGKQIWRFNAELVRPGGGVSRQRGLAYWASGDDRRIYTAVGSYLYALNARTGQLERGFGQGGSVNLGTAVKVAGSYGSFNVFMNSPGVMYKGLYIVGVSGGPGTVQAYNVRTGKLKWVFYTIPRPGEYGYLSWPPNAYKTIGGARPAWAGMALDDKRGIVYVPTSQPDSTFWGGNRIGADLFGNSLVALDASTGKLLWYFQGVHHDLLDRDLADTAPDLLTVMHNGCKIDVVAQGDKIGEVFVFDRATGEPLWQIYERPVPQTKLPGEQTWPTQPFPSMPPPLMRQVYTEDDVSNLSPEAHALTLRRFKRDGSEGPYPAPGLKETIMFPGFDGGMEWGGAAADPEGIYYVNLNEVPWLLQMVATKHAGTPMSVGEYGYVTHCASCHGINRRGDPAGGFPSLAHIGQKLTKGQVSQMVLQGGGGMPSFGRLSTGERQSIIDFLFGDERPAAAYHLAQGTAKIQEGRKFGDLTEPYVFTGFHRWLDGQGYPAIKPPWGILTAVDLNTGKIEWKVPLGEYPELTRKGIPPTGTENYGGPIVTAGGLIFIGATEDDMFRAFDKDTGKVLWQAKLPFGGNATPSTYMTGGKQYVIIPCGGAKGGRPAGGTLVAFALP